MADDDSDVRNLVAQYAQFVKLSDADSIASTFTDDGQLVLPGLPPASGTAEIASMMNRVLRRYDAVVQLVHQGIVDVRGPLATAQWHLTELTRRPDGTAQMLVGTYSDELQRTDQGWRFTRREFAVVVYGPADLPHWISTQPTP